MVFVASRYCDPLRLDQASTTGGQSSRDASFSPPPDEYEDRDDVRIITTTISVPGKRIKGRKTVPLNTKLEIPVGTLLLPLLLLLICFLVLARILVDLLIPVLQWGIIVLQRGIIREDDTPL